MRNTYHKTARWCNFDVQEENKILETLLTLDILKIFTSILNELYLNFGVRKAYLPSQVLLHHFSRGHLLD